MAKTYIQKTYIHKPLMAAIFSVVLAGGLHAAPEARAAGQVDLSFPYAGVAYSQVSDYRSVARAAANVYVKVTVRTPQRAGAGAGRAIPGRNRTVSGASGVILDSSGYVATAAHIARSTALEAELETAAGDKLPASIVHVDKSRDIALLKVEGRAPFATLAPARGVRAGTPVLALGTPGNRRGVVTAGHVVNPRMDRGIRYGDYGNPSPLLLNMHVEPGHSGGPVVDADGRLVGMVIGFDLRRDDNGELVTTGATYAAPFEDLMKLMDLAKF